MLGVRHTNTIALTNKFASSSMDSDDLHAMTVSRVSLEYSLQLSPDPQNRASEDMVGTKSATCLTIGSQLAPTSPVAAAIVIATKSIHVLTRMGSVPKLTNMREYR